MGRRLGLPAEVGGPTNSIGVRTFRFLLIALAALPAGDALGFDQVSAGYEYELPRDYFAHPEFGTEWWYYTGNLATREGRRFGFELTFFRVGLERGGEQAGPWDLNEVHLAHFAVTDIAGGRLLRAERVNRTGPGLAGASLEKATIWNGNWSVEYRLEDPVRPTQRLWAGDGEVVLDLFLQPAKPAVIHGKDGISRKGGGVGQASHYLTFTRLITRGTIKLDGTRYEVEGQSWMDHEFFTEGIATDLEGWDWFSIQLDDGTDVMLYGLRLGEGGYSPFSSGTFVDADGHSLTLESEDILLAPGRTWRSEETTADYPVEWTITVDSLELELSVIPLIDSQEILGDRGFTPAYWEGAVQYSGVRGGTAVTGRGYLEMTGYDEPFSMSVQGQSERTRTGRTGDPPDLTGPAGN